MAGKRKTIQHNMHGVFVFVLLGLFALMSTLLVLMGAQMYRATVQRSTGDNQERVLTSYVRTILHRYDAQGAVRIERQDGVTALALSDGDGYVQCVYFHDGQLWEMYQSELYDLDIAESDDVRSICAARRFEPRLEGHVLTVDLTDENGVDSSVRVALRCAQE